MNKNDRWVLPEGIQEMLPFQAEPLEKLRREILDLFHSWGYELVMPPFVEYLDSLLTGTGRDLDLQTFKLTDQLTGRMMGLRADMTPQVARIDAHHLKREQPVRLCYLGTVLTTRPDGYGGSRSPLQVGAELYGHDSIESDVEIILLMLDMLGRAGLEDIHVDLGHVGIFRGLSKQANLSDIDEATLFDALQRKARAEIDEFLEQIEINKDVRMMLASLVELNGNMDVLERAKSTFDKADDTVKQSLENLVSIATAVNKKLPALSLYFDMAELRGYQYQTGIVFAAYVPGHGQEIVRGGRYDDIGKVFGRARPATGFSADLKNLMDLGADFSYSASGIFSPSSNDQKLWERIDSLRKAGERVVCALPGQKAGAKEMGCDRKLVEKQGTWEVIKI
ncbi:MAG: ATP phosphoribosyltransferase regulatory subunit [Gammaproteobacteria bacterium]|nr:ATP phosphoribosyltransferase regulatory subunit [Gammaproteobacteria bacterium]